MVHVLKKQQTKDIVKKLIAEMRRGFWKSIKKLEVKQIQSYQDEILCEEFLLGEAKITVAAFHSVNSIVLFLIRGWVSEIEKEENIKKLHPLANIEVSTTKEKNASMFPWTGGKIFLGVFLPEEMEVFMRMQVVTFEYSQKRKPKRAKPAKKPNT